MERSVRKWDLVLTVGLFLLLALTFMPECDDCYFAYWSYDSLWDFLRTRPILEEGVVGVPANGRYLGNLLGVVLGKLAFSPLWWLRTLVLWGGLVGLTLVLARFLEREGLSAQEARAISLSMVVLSHVGIWQQVYSWAAAFSNYLIPGVLVLSILLLLGENRRKLWPVVLILSAAGCLFAEPYLIFLVVFSVGLAAAGLFPAIRRRLPDLALRLALLAGSWAGAALCLTNSAMAQVSSGDRGLGLEQAVVNVPIIFTEVLLRPVPLAAAVSVMLLWLNWRQGNRWWRLWAALLLPLHLLIAWDQIQVFLGRRVLYRAENLWLGLPLALIWVVLAVQWRGGEAKKRLWLWVGALLTTAGPLLVVAGMDARMFFPAYLFLCLAAAVLYGQARAQGLRPQGWLRWLSLGVGVALLAVYFCNARVYTQRLDYAREQAAAGAEEITLPLVPFPRFNSNELPGKGDIVFLVYQEKPWDISFTFLPYEEYRAQYDVYEK